MLQFNAKSSFRQNLTVLEKPGLSPLRGTPPRAERVADALEQFERIEDLLVSTNGKKHDQERFDSTKVKLIAKKSLASFLKQTLGFLAGEMGETFTGKATLSPDGKVETLSGRLEIKDALLVHVEKRTEANGGSHYKYDYHLPEIEGPFTRAQRSDVDGTLEFRRGVNGAITVLEDHRVSEAELQLRDARMQSSAEVLGSYATRKGALGKQISESEATARSCSARRRSQARVASKGTAKG